MLTFQQECWSKIENEILSLAQEHWAEMPFDLKIPLDLALGTYRGLADDGRLHVTTARLDGILAGYFVVFLGRHPHYDVLTGSMDVYYLKPELRKGAAGLRLFLAMERNLQSHGVRYLLATARLDRGSHAHALFERLGWKAARVLYEKRLEAK